MPTLELDADLTGRPEIANVAPLPPYGEDLRFALPPACAQVGRSSPSDRPTVLMP